LSWCFAVGGTEPLSAGTIVRMEVAMNFDVPGTPGRSAVAGRKCVTATWATQSPATVAVVRRVREEAPR